MNDKPINILITVDDNYVQHAAVMMASLLDKTSKNINLYLMYCELSAQNIDKFKNFLMGYKNIKAFNPTYVNLKKYLDKPPIKSYLTKTTYLRILAPYFINDNYVIYLDPDLILLDDISKILDETNLNIETPFLYAVESCVNHKIKLGLTAEEPTFCGGIMVLNLNSMHKLNIPEKCIKFILDNENIIVGPLDDSLNVIAKGKWKPLNPKWNVYYKMIYNFEVYTSQSICYTMQDIKNALNKPSIVHFTGPIKPWHYIDKHPYKKYYWNYLKQTPWKDYKPSDKNFKNFLKKYFIDFIKLRRSIIKFWKRYFTRKKFIRLNKLLYELGLHGIGIKNFNKDMIITGEANFIKSYFKDNDRGVVFDVGAFIGSYSKKILDITEKVEIYAFEPNPKNYEKLINNINNKRFHPYNVAVGNDNGYVDLFDKKMEGTSHASIYEESIGGIYNVKPAVKHSVKMIKLDDFCLEHKIDFIELLKIDVEGNEFEVLKGASNLLNNRKIKTTQFEFNDTHIYSRVFFKDFYDLLHKNYNLYRMLPDGLIPIATYNPIYCEIFAYQNIVAKLKT